MVASSSDRVQYYMRLIVVAAFLTTTHAFALRAPALRAVPLRQVPKVATHRLVVNVRSRAPTAPSIVRPRPRPKAARVVEREEAVTETPPAAPTLPRRRDLDFDEGSGNLWDVLLHNDDIHTFDYTIQALAKCVPITRKKAHTIVVEVHSKGRARVWQGWKPRAKMICICLQSKGLTSTIAKAKRPL